jgi:hypothetical protein
LFLWVCAAHNLGVVGVVGVMGAAKLRTAQVAPTLYNSSIFNSLWMYTMNRCNARSAASFFIAASAVLISFSSLFYSDSYAQTMRREVPANAKRGDLTVTLPPQVTLDGNVDRLSPGARIRNTQNLMVLSGTLVGQELPVVYRRDSAGLIHEVWILSADEARTRTNSSRTIFNVITESLPSNTPSSPAKTGSGQ